ncbi:uncharacterized protein LOC125855726 [Solanum stenotomum]|uniref:uncharacterized protein LOC125855726 n=1 Tax=Solanum stenotomum TaxID=172797 RepID=UPI0020D0A38F|nr:uncharacterized protein LOC125855726 [Solanum stenotomum]
MNASGIPKYVKYVKDIVASKRRLMEYETVVLTEECNSRIQNRLPKKLKDPGSFTVQITIGKCVEPADCVIKERAWGGGGRRCVSSSRLINFPIDFVVLDFEVPFILGYPFLDTGRALIDVASGQLTMMAHDKVEVFDVYCVLKLPFIYDVFSAITVVDQLVESQVVVPEDLLERLLTGHEVDGDTEA